MKFLKMFALSWVVLMLVGTSLFAQGFGGQSGTLSGEVKDEKGAPLPGVLVTVSGAAGSKTATTEVDGKFVFPYLTPGTYDVRAELQSYTTIEQSDVDIRLGQRTEVTFKMKPGQEELVVVTGENPTVDVSSTTTGASISDTLLKSIPIGRGFNSAINLSPGVSGSGVGGGNYSISGGSGLENSYIVDGVNITDTGYGAVGGYAIIADYQGIGTGVTQDFIKEVQVKTGGFEPEYGEALGGVVNVVTKSGGNAFTGSGYVNFAPGGLYADPKLVETKRVLYTNTTEEKSVDGGINMGGPVIKDKVFFFGAYNPRKTTTTFISDPRAPLHAEFPEAKYDRKSQGYAAKGSFNATANHTFEFSAFGDPSTGPVSLQRQSGINTTGPESQRSSLDYGSNDQVVRWTGILRPNMFAEASFGRTKHHFTETPGTNQNSVFDYATSTTSGGLGYYDNSEGRNLQYGAKFTNIWKGHEFRYGIGYDDIKYVGGANYSGLPFATVFPGVTTATGASITAYPGEFFGVGGTVYSVDRCRINSPFTETKTKYLDWFVQDSWNATSRLNVKAGVRWERQEMDGQAENIKFDGVFAPRLGASYDYLGNGKSKIYGSWGRFYEKIPNDIAVRAFSAEISYTGYFYDAALTQPLPAPYAPNISGAPTVVEGFAPSTSSNKTKPQYSDEYVIGGEQEVGAGLSLGARYIKRNIKNVIEDVQYDPRNGAAVTLENWDEIFNSGAAYNYFITNMDGKDHGSVLAGLGPFGLTPLFVRDYKAFELTSEKRLSKNWQILASYRWSKLKGNYEGLYRRDNGQSDPNITSLGDFAQTAAMGYTYIAGPLPNDSTNSFKIFGSYQFNFGLNTGFAYNGRTGRPLTAIGMIPNYGSRERLVGPRGGDGRTDFLSTIDWHLDYSVKAGRGNMKFGADFFNLFNSQQVTAKEQRTQRLTTSLSNIVPDIDYGQITGYATPRTIRFLVDYSW